MKILKLLMQSFYCIIFVAGILLCLPILLPSMLIRWFAGDLRDLRELSQDKDVVFLPFTLMLFRHRR